MSYINFLNTIVFVVNYKIITCLYHLKVYLYEHYYYSVVVLLDPAMRRVR